MFLRFFSPLSDKVYKEVWNYYNLNLEFLAFTLKLKTVLKPGFINLFAEEEF